MEQIINLPGYEVLRKIGEGGMATVWAARQVSLDRIVAIKILTPRLILDPVVLQRFRQEAQSTAKLKHPGIVQVYDAGEHEGLAYLVLEFVAGCTVAELLDRKGRLVEKHALLIAEGVALALAYAWNEAGIIHCDIKPANVIIDEDGAIKLGDLGLARSIGLTAAARDKELFEGTPNYASPEQVRADPDLDCRADIYSLGAMLYHLTTGRLPFGRTDDDEIMENQLSGFLLDPMDVQADLSPGMACLIEKMMIKDRALRCASWDEVQADIEEVKQGRPPAGPLPEPGISTVQRSAARSRLLEKPVALPAKPKEKPNIRVKPAAKQKIVLPDEFRKQVHATSAPSAHASRSVYALLLMLIAVVSAYGALSYFRSSRNQQRKVNEGYWENMLPPRSQVSQTTASVNGYRTTPVGGSTAPATAVAVAPAPGVATTTVHWENPTFIRGANQFNDALAQYKKYAADKQNPAVLVTIEKQSRDAIKAFESCRRYAPPEVKISELIEQCYRLISDCRQSTLMVSTKDEPKRKPAEATGPTPSAVARPSGSAKSSDPLVLAPTWNSFMRGGDQILSDLKDVLAGHGQADVDLKPDSTLVLFGQISYLMPVTEAAKTLNLALPPRKNLGSPGFPKDSLFFYVVAMNSDDGFNTLLLITDNTDRIVAVERVNERPDESLWLDPQLFAEKWHAYNFIQGRTKGSAKWRVAHRVEEQGRILRIDSELVDNDEFGYFGLGDSKERVQLFLPQPLVNIILYRIEKMGKT
jgi:serine/threonine protein kinase